jgi:hypothetical protein
VTVHCGRSVRELSELRGRARQSHPVTRRVCDARQRKSAVIGVHHTTESKLGSYFAAGLEHAGLSHAAPILAAEANGETRLLKVTVALQNVADWKLRSQVHQVALRVEDEHDVTVLCCFRPLDPLPTGAAARAGATWTSLCRTQRSVPRVTPRAVRSLNRLAYCTVSYASNMLGRLCWGSRLAAVPLRGSAAGRSPWIVR